MDAWVVNRLFGVAAPDGEVEEGSEEVIVFCSGENGDPTMKWFWND